MPRKTHATAKDLRPKKPLPKLTLARKLAIDGYLKMAGHKVSRKTLKEISAQWTG